MFSGPNRKYLLYDHEIRLKTYSCKSEKFTLKSDFTIFIHYQKQQNYLGYDILIFNL